MFDLKNLREVESNVWQIEKSFRRDMKVPARVFASRKMLQEISADESLEQIVNVATLPGIVGEALAMPDIHEGYGFPIGGVAALDARTGVISPGGVGYDINCGVRLLKSRLNYFEISNKIEKLANQIMRDVPSGVGRGGELVFRGEEMDKVLSLGAEEIVAKGYGEDRDLVEIESQGHFHEADPRLVSDRAKARGRDQAGTLGAGNHFVEVLKVEQIFDARTARIFGLFKDQIVLLIHTGSRGLGHQVCTDYLRVMMQAMPKYGIKLPDRELACVPFASPEGQKYFQAMYAAANFGFANRQVLTHLVRESLKQAISPNENLEVLYDVAHNVAKLEEHGGRKLVVHRKGATRAFGPGSNEIPAKYREVGQPVIIPGSMGTASYVLAGTEDAMKKTFGSTCHGAGRRMSRKKAKKMMSYEELQKDLERRGVIAKTFSRGGLLEEAPQAYKDVNEVVDVVQKTGISRKVAKLKPLAVVKG